MAQDKSAAIESIATQFTNAGAAVLTEYRGLSTEKIAQLRAALGPQASYAIVKNTLASIAARQVGLQAFEGQFVGPTAIAFIGGDLTEAAQRLRTFAKTHPQLVIKGACLGGQAITAEQVQELAQTSTRAELMESVAALLRAPQAQAAALVAQPVIKTARVLRALRAKQVFDLR